MLEIERRNLLPQRQAGFRPGKSTTYNIVRLERYAESHLKKSKIFLRKTCFILDLFFFVVKDRLITEKILLINFVKMLMFHLFH